MTSLSIVVCCYNSALRIAPTLKHLSELVVPDNVEMDVIIVDNASTDNTNIIVQDYWEAFGNKFLLQVVHEPSAGLSYARNRGVTASNAEWILLCDDDNYLNRFYVSELFKASFAFENVGIAGGWGEPVFESSKPAWWEKASMWYACGPLQQNTGEIGSVNGAGMLIQKKIFETQFFRIPMFLTDRVKGDLISGGDMELCMRAKLAGYKVIFVRDAIYGHWMPDGRMTLNYLRKLLKGIGRGFELLKSYEPRVEGLIRACVKFGYGITRLLLLPTDTFGLSKIDVLCVRWDSFQFFLVNRHIIRRNQQLIQNLCAHETFKKK